MKAPIRLQIERRDNPQSAPYWQGFEIPWRPGHNLVSVLMVIRENPVTTDGQLVEPVVWEHNCMEEVCGACSMLINGTPRQACSALVDELEQPIRLQPLSKFPVVRDLLVDRSRIFDSLKQVKAWVPLDGPYDIHERAPRISPQQWLNSYAYSRCMSCGCCLEACPQYGEQSAFLGPAALVQVQHKNRHPTGRYSKTERLHVIMGDGGLSDCGNAQVCISVCPKRIPITTAIGELGRDLSRQLLIDLLGKG
ncbi:succinate dehydrogenase iron-sulfur subunit [endosymbiont of Ridgeia piscesae]|jgi:succinate dehydrogenase / fumarate reductase iron-sulfur subunit|uniref:succinate dehydrogenase n=1 Tax=endosymbiont of Ridgeia piscesae TaxID=54398 RepID=A0A0T5YZN4_9GAMM|nr:succinate dehydrogenase iron-sulfur subunit [endosymbiont of Ridgeia piscesae]KRT56090.1 succinate dehydrogenase and fumarate reductase iron-sulfur protein [endosymbiont of Ridgeia piscesae]KRT59663.1 succinate dehydrogenase subunit B [endosymbiont of Ridgeia piscesae]